MRARDRLLEAFVGISLFGLILVGLVIYDSSIESHTRSEQYILESFSKHIISMVERDSALLSDSEAIVSKISGLRMDNLHIFLKDDAGKLYSTYGNKKPDNAYTLKFIKTLIEGGTNSGHIHKKDSNFSWWEAGIPNSQAKLILIRKSNAVTFFQEFYDTFGTPLLVVGLVIMWISVWGGLITRGLFRKVEEQKDTLHKQASELEQAKDRAISANEAKSTFLSSMSHELRTPLNAVLGFAQLLRINIKTASPELQLDNIKEIENAGEHLLALINDVLDLAKIESGHVDMTIEAVQLNKLLDECETLIGPSVEDHRLTLKSCENLDDTVVVRADYVRLKQVLLNLLSNACKYNKSGGSITINCNITDNGLVHISIEDTGKGISQEQQSKLFVPFNRLGAEQTEIEGTGIGLVITRQLIEIMGGRIGVESESGKGSAFWIELEQEKSAGPVS